MAGIILNYTPNSTFYIAEGLEEVDTSSLLDIATKGILSSERLIARSAKPLKKVNLKAAKNSLQCALLAGHLLAKRQWKSGAIATLGALTYGALAAIRLVAPSDNAIIATMKA